jgi:hypothetical protein
VEEIKEEDTFLDHEAADEVLSMAALCIAH